MMLRLLSVLAVLPSSPRRFSVVVLALHEVVLFAWFPAVFVRVEVCSGHAVATLMFHSVVCSAVSG
jgi:hypothetical protein